MTSTSEVRTSSSARFLPRAHPGLARVCLQRSSLANAAIPKAGGSGVCIRYRMSYGKALACFPLSQNPCMALALSNKRGLELQKGCIDPSRMCMFTWVLGMQT